MKKILFVLIFVIVLSCCSCKKNDTASTLADADASDLGEYTVVYEPTFEQRSVANYDFSDRIIATNESDDVSDDKTVNELDVAATLRFTGVVREKDKDERLSGLSRWYTGVIKPKDEISYEAVTIGDAAEIVKLYVDAYYYAITPDQIDSVFSKYDKKATLTHKDFKVIIAKITALCKQSGFKFDISADDVSKICIFPSLMECTPGNENDLGVDLDKGKEIYKERTVNITDKTEIEKELEFLKNVKVLKASYIDSTVTGDSYGYAVYDNDGNEILGFALINDNHVFLDDVSYSLEEGTFEQHIEKVVVEIDEAERQRVLEMIENSES